MSDVPGVVVSATDAAAAGDNQPVEQPAEENLQPQGTEEQAPNSQVPSDETVEEQPAAEATDEEQSVENTDATDEEQAPEQVADSNVDTPLVESVDPSDVKDALKQDDEEAIDDEFVPDVLDMPPHELRGVLEALLLVSNKPLKIEQIEKCLPGSKRSYLEGFLKGISEIYAREQRGFDVRKVGGGWQLLTRVQFHPWVRQLDKKELPTRLSKSAMETLSIVAYKQPVSRGKIEDIRGVQCGPMLRQLMDMHLVHVVGRDEEALGRPLLYATTEQFLERFGLGSVDDLPRQHEFGG